MLQDTNPFFYTKPNKSNEINFTLDKEEFKIYDNKTNRTDIDKIIENIDVIIRNNCDTINTTDSCKNVLDLIEISAVVLLLILIVVIIVGNTLIILAVVTTKRLRTVTNCFVTSLAVADVLVGTFVMPPAVAVHITGKWELGWILCNIWICLDILLCTASILSLCAISIDRYLAVTRPLTYSRRRRSKKLALTMILFVWIAAGAITCPPIFGWYEANNEDNVCQYNQNPGYVVFSAMGSFFLPMIVMVYVYARISCVVARRHQLLSSRSKVKKTKQSCIRAESDSSDINSVRQNQKEKCDCCSRANSKKKKKDALNEAKKKTVFSIKEKESNRVSSLRRETKTAQTLSLVVGGFILCWLPFFIYYIITPFIPVSHVHPILMYVFTWLGWFNSAINPFIYAFYSPDFRVAFWRLTIKRCFFIQK